VHLLSLTDCCNDAQVQLRRLEQQLRSEASARLQAGAQDAHRDAALRTAVLKAECDQRVAAAVAFQVSACAYHYSSFACILLQDTARLQCYTRHVSALWLLKQLL
jgi:hypothetical protein